MQFTDRHPRGRPHYVSVAVAAQRSILFRLDEAFNAFFERVRRGETPGFPRFNGQRCGAARRPHPAGGGNRAAEDVIVSIVSLFSGELINRPGVLDHGDLRAG